MVHRKAKPFRHDADDRTHDASELHGAAEDLGFGLLPNPGLGDFGALANYDMLGGALWGGSEEGLNSSIAMTLVLTALVIPLLPVFSRDRRAARSA